MLNFQILSVIMAKKIAAERIARSVQPASPEVLSHATCVSLDEWQVNTQGGVQLFAVNCNSLLGEHADAKQRETHLIRLEQQRGEKERLYNLHVTNESAASQAAAECARIEKVGLDDQIGQTTPLRRYTWTVQTANITNAIQHTLRSHAAEFEANIEGCVQCNVVWFNLGRLSVVCNALVL